MNEYEKDLRYLKHQLNTSHMLDQLNAAKRTLRHFEDKWMLQLSPTDPIFQKDRNELNEIYNEKYTRISRAYLLN